MVSKIQFSDETSKAHTNGAAEKRSGQGWNPIGEVIGVEFDDWERRARTGTSMRNMC